MDNEKAPKIDNKYYCEKCNFTCSKKSDYARHLSTAKHKKQEMDNEKAPNIHHMCLWERIQTCFGLRDKEMYIFKILQKRDEVSEDM